MDQYFCIGLCIFCVSQSVMAFNLNPASWKTFTAPSGTQNLTFGYKVIQRDASSLIVSDPIVQVNQDKRGQIYNCSVMKGICTLMNINVPSEAVNMSLGLSMVKDPSSSNLVVCGPTIPKNCSGVTTYNGMCFIDGSSGFTGPIPSSLRECPYQIDIAFLLDGSGSVYSLDFNKMKAFVIEMIKSFIDRDAQFAVAQFSSIFSIHCKFQQVKDPGWWAKEVNGISQFGGATYTATAIKLLVKNLFVSSGGARPSASKILVVITDGQSNDPKRDLPEAVELAKNITRYAIGVGNAFNVDYAIKELALIASLPTNKHVFKVDNFDALESIREKLKENIIAIEGTQTSGDSSRMEFAQDGFSATLISNTEITMTAVGAFQWKGGYQLYKPNNQSNVFHAGNEHESYLGYSLAIAVVNNLKYAVMGAPRHMHKGQVTVSRIYQTNSQNQLDPPEPQIGSYFGAEVCVVDLNSDSNTDLLLVSAPMYTESEREGKVFVYTLTQRPSSSYFSFSDVVLVGMAGQRGRFGSSLASPADLNGDGLMDVLVGAPLEEDGQGSIYIFNGREGGVISSYSQRIAGSSVQSGLQFFGVSFSQSSPDQTQDGLPDVAVGSKGAVVLLRSRPIALLETKVTYSPSKISTDVQTNCSTPMQNKMSVCFIMRKYGHNKRDLNATIAYNITLDAKRQKYRAFFSEKKHVLADAMNISNLEVCKSHGFLIEACPEDALNPLSNQLTFTYEGLPSSEIQNLKPILLPEIKTTTDYNLDFEINCGQDNVCVDDLRVDFNFSGSALIEVGKMLEINLTVFVENRGENSYNTLFTLKYPYGFSYRRFTLNQGRVECSSLDGEQGVRLGETDCFISKPILKSNTQVVFEITYSISKESTLGQNVMFSASVKSGNDKHSEDSEFYKQKTIAVKYAINVVLIRHENFTIHMNFTSGKNLSKPLQHIIKIENDFRPLIFKVYIRVPVKLGDIDIWKNSTLKISDCVRNTTEQPMITNFKDAIKKQHVVNCSVAECALFICDVDLIKMEKKFYNITGNVSSEWIEQTGLKAAVFELVSTTTMDYDHNKYVFFSSESRNTAPSLQISTQVEVFEEVDLTKEIIGGAIGGLLLLAIVTAALYKAGFFKSQYKTLLEEAQGEAGGQAAKPQ